MEKVKPKKKEPTPYEIASLGLQGLALLIATITFFKK